jgi:rhamnopyranosyl-N-acetylglucosaminyl-diphospho-decaprenol beta-1,3/1,4-galactofuranosyltransferase
MRGIAAIVVTYNRFDLLQETIRAIKAQTNAVQNIIVIDNGSTDNTGVWLDQQPGLMVIHQANAGGSGGFYTGLKQAAALKCDWAWVMDDDTICRPNTLHKLVEKLDNLNEQIGFISSKSIWNDGTPHLMNIPAITPTFNGLIPFNKFDERQVLLVENSSFVSLLINMGAVKTVGLPYKEFFIWGDDQEYTKRITKAGYLGLYCADSVVLHKTPTNYFPDFYRDSTGNLWKHSYGFRNEFFMVKKNKGVFYYTFWLIGKLTYTSYKLLKIRDKDAFKFIGVLFRSGLKSVFFNPQIDKI